MRKTVSAILFVGLVACQARKDAARSVQVVQPKTTPGAVDEPAAGSAMALDEGKLGKKDANRGEAIAAAQTAGVLAGRSAGHASLTRGFDGRFDADDATGEAYHDWGKNPWTVAAKDHLSTFAADVDTASYTIARRKLREGTLPPKASVRVEEMVNYFRYAFPPPATGSPFSVVMDAMPSPLEPARDILRVGVATRPKSEAERKPAHLVFLVDVSGSMDEPDKLPLVKSSLDTLTRNLEEGDTVAIVTYAGATRLVMPPTGMDHRGQIIEAIDSLEPGGSTAMASGIDLAYQQAMQGLTKDAISRVIVCTDGDANVGAHTHEEILKIIASRAAQGVTLSTIGFGMGNYKDELMEQLADKGNGNNFYIDSPAAAKKVFEEQLGSMLEVVAKDVKLQVDFDPSLVARYRLVGYEDRDIADQDFRNDKVDAGEVGAGHQVTALYELELTAAGKQANAPLATLRVRYKQPRGEKATEVGFPMVGGPAASFANAPVDARFAFAVAAFADVLRGGQDAEHWSLAQIRDLARNAAGDDPDRKEFVGMIQQAMRITGRTTPRSI